MAKRQRLTARSRLMKVFIERLSKSTLDYIVEWTENQAENPQLPAPELPDTISENLEAVRFLMENRYIEPRLRKPFSTDARDRVLDAFSDRDRQGIIRLTAGQLDDLAERIQHSRHFKIRRGADRLACIKARLKVALYRLGTKGVSIKKTSFHFGVGEGSVHNYTWECILAIADLSTELIEWPNEERKAEIRDWFKVEKGFPNAIGAVDGVPFPLESAPSSNPHRWVTRKCNYAMGATAVCDHVGRFTFVRTGYVGKMHDSAAYKATPLFMEPILFFHLNEYLLADAAYALTPTVIPRYKNADGDEASFNIYHGSARVVIEHAFGMLKLKFQSLQNIPVKIRSRSDAWKASRWIIACFVLHNFIRIGLNEELVDECVREEVRNRQREREENGNQQQGGEVHLELVNPADQQEMANLRERGVERRNKLKRWVMRNRERIRRRRQQQ